MENFLLLLIAGIVIAVLLAFAREKVRGQYLGYGFRWKPMPPRIRAANSSRQPPGATPVGKNAARRGNANQAQNGRSQR
jgi:hypothetical protein